MRLTRLWRTVQCVYLGLRVISHDSSPKNDEMGGSYDSSSLLFGDRLVVHGTSDCITALRGSRRDILTQVFVSVYYIPSEISDTVPSAEDSHTRC